MAHYHQGASSVYPCCFIRCSLERVLARPRGAVYMFTPKNFADGSYTSAHVTLARTRTPIVTRRYLRCYDAPPYDRLRQYYCARKYCVRVSGRQSSRARHGRSLAVRSRPKLRSTSLARAPAVAPNAPPTPNAAVAECCRHRVSSSRATELRFRKKTYSKKINKYI